VDYGHQASIRQFAFRQEPDGLDLFSQAGYIRLMRDAHTISSCRHRVDACRHGWLYVVVLVIAGLSGACRQTETAAAITTDEIAKTSTALTAYLDAEFEEELAMSPEWLTMLGRKERYDSLDARSDAETDRRLAWRRESVRDMKARFDPARLDEEARTSFEMWALQLELQEKGAQFRRQPYIFIKDGDHASLPNFLINFHSVAAESDMEAYVARLRALPTALDQDLERAKLAAAAGNREPRFAYDQALQESRNLITGAPFGPGPDSPLFADVKAKIKKLSETGKISGDEARGLHEAATKALTGQVKPAYERVIAWLTEDKSHAAPDAQGVWALQDGAGYYDAQLYLQTTTRMTADEIHQLGLSEVARIRGEMEKVKEEVGFKGTLEEFFIFMRTSPRFYLPDTDAGRAKYLELAEAYLAAMKAKMPSFFGILPRAGLVVKRVEAFREEPGGAQHYFPGTPDGSRAGTFYAHLSDMKAMPTYELETIAYHEGVPGHHLQVSIAQERSGIPKFRTQYGYTAYQEGWGLYAEALARDHGFFTDPYSEFGRLAAEIWRAVRLVVDTGIHAKHWTESQAVEYFLANTAKPEAAVRSEVRRYFVWPGQATTYKIGMIELRKLRATAQQELGGAFDERAFHDTVLGGGALPLPVLEARVRRWIDQRKVVTP
jgi:uncharacterized protein (DUF885 family)